MEKNIYIGLLNSGNDSNTYYVAVLVQVMVHSDTEKHKYEDCTTCYKIYFFLIRFYVNCL